MNLAQVERLLSVFDDEHRQEIVQSSDRFAKFVKVETTNRSVLAAARANKADSPPAVQVMMERAAERVLAEAYLARVIRVNSDPGFPSDDEMRDFYAKNAGAFVTPVRVHLWQIFFPLPEDPAAEAVKNGLAEATRVVAVLRKKSAEFGAMAKKYSAHEQSRVADGYMGLLNVDALLPEIRAAVDKIPVGAISDPVRTRNGLHIIKRGAMVEPETIRYEQVTAQIRKQMQEQAAQRIRSAALEKIAASFPVAVSDQEIEQWRAKLQQEPPGKTAEHSAQAPVGAQQ